MKITNIRGVMQTYFKRQMMAETTVNEKLLQGVFGTMNYDL